MIKVIHVQKAAILVLLLGLLAGCGSLAPKKGVISGRVVHSDGSPIARAQVLLVEQNRITESTLNGDFTFTGLPGGRYTVVVSCPQLSQPFTSKQYAGYKLIANQGEAAALVAPSGEQVSLPTVVPEPTKASLQPAIPQATRQVVLGQGQTTSMADIVIAPVFNNTDGVALVEANPKFGTVLSGGSTTNVSFDVYYGLASKDKGKIGLLVYYETVSKNYVVAKYEKSISKGSGKVELGGSLQVPAVAKLEMQLVLLDESDDVLMLNNVSAYSVGGGSTPIAPRLSAEATPYGMRLSWQNGTPEKFTKFMIRRNPYSGYTYDGNLVATVTDMNSHEVMDLSPSVSNVNTTFYYQLFAYTASGTRYDSNVVDIKFRQNFDKVQFAAYMGGIALDQNGLVYLSDTSHDRIVVFSSTTNKVVEELPVCSRPSGLAVNQDSSLLAVACSGGSKVVTVNLQNRTERKAITGLERPDRVVFSPDGKVLYALGYNGYIWKVDIASSTVVNTLNTGATYTPSAGGLTIGPDNYLYVTGLGTTVNAYRTSDFVEVNSLDGVAPVVTAQEGTEIFVHKGDYDDFTTNIYLANGAAGTVKTLDTTIFASTPDNQRIYGISLPNASGSPVPMLCILESVSGSWVTRQQLHMANIGIYPQADKLRNSAVTPDGKKLFLLLPDTNQTSALLVFDLEELGVS